MLRPAFDARPTGLFLLAPKSFDAIYDSALRDELSAEVDMPDRAFTAADVQADPGLLTDVDVIFSGWGMARVDEVFLAAAPRLKAVFYGAGAVGGFATAALFARGVVVTSAALANAVPVAEYTLATLLFGLKHGWRMSRDMRAARRPVRGAFPPGNYGSTVGLCSMGLIARLVCDHLRRFDLNVLAYDPFLGDAEAASLGVTKVGLEELFARSDAVSLHTPALPETRGMVDAALLSSMKPGATLINTARGSVVNEPDLIRVLTDRPDLQAVLDVTDPEPPPPDSPLYTLPNVVLTPHVAGSFGPECRRMGRMMLDEFRRWRSGQPMSGRVTPETARHSAHLLGRNVFETSLIGSDAT